MHVRRALIVGLVGMIVAALMGPLAVIIVHVSGLVGICDSGLGCGILGLFAIPFLYPVLVRVSLTKLRVQRRKEMLWLILVGVAFGVWREFSVFVPSDNGYIGLDVVG